MERQKLTIVRGVRLPAEDIVLLEKICKQRGENFSTFMRRAAKKELASLGYISGPERKALGLI